MRNNEIKTVLVSRELGTDRQSSTMISGVQNPSIEHLKQLYSAQTIIFLNAYVEKRMMKLIPL
jgi:hypothetical protein